MCVEAIHNFLALTLFSNFITIPAILEIMASMPLGTFATEKVKGNMILSQHYAGSNDVDMSPSKYCDKMMNSIWGLYNRYSVHNFKSAATSQAANVNMMQQQSAIVKNGQNWLSASPLEGMMQMKF